MTVLGLPLHLSGSPAPDTSPQDREPAGFSPHLALRVTQGLWKEEREGGTDGQRQNEGGMDAAGLVVRSVCVSAFVTLLPHSKGFPSFLSVL